MQMGYWREVTDVDDPFDWTTPYPLIPNGASDEFALRAAQRIPT